ncbi:MAG: DUF302 domain-containing protein [Acidimicrobiales bacterium]
MAGISFLGSRRSHPDRTVRRRLDRLRVALVAFSVAVATLGAVATSPASAQGTPPRVEPAVEFNIVGDRCSVEVIAERVRPDGTTIITSEQVGLTESSIALMTGTLTVRSTAVIAPDGMGRITGRWTLQPAASTGAIRGTLRGSVNGPEISEVISTGHGIQALRGVLVQMTTTSPADGSRGESDCASDLSFEGSGTASYRDERNPVGAVVVESTKSFEDSVADLSAAIEANPNLRLVRTVDHSAAAAGRGIVLAPTTEVFFGNPAIGTPLMQASQTTGIDLPQKMLIWEDLFGIVRVGYNAPAYLQSRHGIDGADAQLETIARALAGLAGVATGTTVDPVFDAGTVRERAGLVKVSTTKSVAEAHDDIVAALEAAPPVGVALQLDHQQNAASVGLELRPTKLVVFGNPSLGSNLMRTDQSIALDLPQKMLIYTDADGQTFVAYNNPYAVAQRHDVRGQGRTLELLSGALANFAAVGT